jgi:hypothetical protein
MTMGAMRKPDDEFPIQILSLDAIMVDHALQSRVATSIEYQRDFSHAMLRGAVFKPVVVFWDGQYYWLADGFHRWGAAKHAATINPELWGIRAEIHPGTRRDAMIFSAGANIVFSIPRTREDIEKAINMLLDDEECRGWTDEQIRQHVGCTLVTVRKYRVLYYTEHDLPLPPRAPQPAPEPTAPPPASGKVGTTRPPRPAPVQPISPPDREFEPLSLPAEESRRQSLERKALVNFFLMRGDQHFSMPSAKGNHPEILALEGLVHRHCVCVTVRPHDPAPVASAVGRVRLLSRWQMRLGTPARPPRMIILGFPDEHAGIMRELVREDGVEFLTPQELLDSLVRQGETGN